MNIPRYCFRFLSEKHGIRRIKYQIPYSLPHLFKTSPHNQTTTPKSGNPIHKAIPTTPNKLPLPATPQILDNLTRQLDKKASSLNDRQNNRRSSRRKNPQEASHNPKDKKAFGKDVVAQEHGNGNEEEHDEGQGGRCPPCETKCGFESGRMRIFVEKVLFHFYFVFFVLESLRLFWWRVGVGGGDVFFFCVGVVCR